MSTKLGTVVADFTTSLATALAVGGESVTLQSATDDDSVALPTGRYFFTIDGGNSSKEHISCTLTGTSLTSVKSVSRQGVETTGVSVAHRIGATVVLTDFAHLRYLADLLDGTTDLDSTAPLKYDGTATISDDAHLATKKYVDDVTAAGAADASTTVKGLSEEATQAEIDADTAAGGTSARLFINPSTLATSRYGTQLPSSAQKDGLAATTTPATGNLFTTQKDFQIGAEIYAADAGSNDTYVVTLSPAPAAYVNGMVVRFKANTVNTGACTLNVNTLGAIAIKVRFDVDPADGDIKAGQHVTVMYNGTNFEMQSTPSTLSVPQYAAVIATRAGNTATGNQTIAHGLSGTPTRIKVTSTWNPGSARATAQSTGVYEGSASHNVWVYYDDVGAVSGAGSNTTDLVLLQEASGAQTGIFSSIDGTNLTIGWTKSSSPGSENMNMLLEFWI